MSKGNREQRKLKAYSVQGDEFGTVVFATCGVVARREGANELNIEFQDVESCRRIPDLDNYSAQGSVPWKVLVEDHGWIMECAGCYKRVASDTEGSIWADENTVYCRKECVREHKNE